MGQRSGAEPSSGQAPLRRMLNALNMTIDDLAREIAPDDKMHRGQVRWLLKRMADEQLATLPDVELDGVWFEIAAYLDRQYAYVTAARAEYQRLLQRQREQRAVRDARREQLPTPPPAPRRPG